MFLDLHNNDFSKDYICIDFLKYIVGLLIYLCVLLSEEKIFFGEGWKK